ncbi:hypothetical protein Hdeb2414_s0004g00147401 [Helianthus debilis subsp. tardiflorus]
MRGPVSKSDNCVTIDGVIMKTRYKSGLLVDPGQVHFGCRKTIKLNEEPNTIKIHASAHCLVVNFKRRIRSHYVK